MSALMQSGAPLTLECPACGHAFMALQSRPDTVVSCPHCARNDVLSGFTIANTNSPLSQARRVQTQRRVPRVTHTDSPPQTPESQSAVQVENRDPPVATQKHGAMNLHWPGMGRVELEGQRPVAPSEFGPPIEPVRRSSWPQWLLAILLTAVCATTTVLLIRQQQQSSRSAAQMLDQRTMTSSQENIIPAANVEKPRDFVEDRIERARSAESAETLLKTLFENPSHDAKAACVYPVGDRAKFEAFFTPTGQAGAPGLIAMKELPHQPVLLPSRESVAMFSVMTTRNNHGALLRLIKASDGQPRIFWPLFQETHDRVLTAYIEARSPDPAWFHVGFRKVHSFQLPESERGTYDAIDVDGSTDGSSHIVTYVPVNSPVGRYLESEMEWGRLYLGRLLLGWTDIGDQRHLTILDCEGANITGRELPESQTEETPPSVAK